MPDWPTKPLGEVVTNHDSRRVPLSGREREMRRGSYPYYGAAGVIDFIDAPIFRGLHLLIGEDGSVARDDGTPFAQLADGEFWVNNHAHVLRGETDSDTRFVYYALSTTNIRPWVTGAVQPKLNQRNMNQIPIPFPPEPSRNAIVRVLGAMDDKIEQNRRTARAQELLARAIFRAWFVDFEPVKAKAEGATSFPSMPQPVFDVLPTGFVDSDVGPVPEGWDLVHVYDVADVCYGAPFSSQLFNEHCDGLPLIRIRDLQTHEPKVFTPERHPRDKVIRPGNIVVGMDGEFRLYYWVGPEALLNQRLCTFEPKENIPRVFLGESLRKPLAYFEGAKTGTTVIHLGKADIDTFRLLRPEDSVLSAFGAATDSLLRLFLHAARESRSLAAMRNYLLPKLLSGQVRVESAHG